MKLSVAHPASLGDLRGFEGRWVYADDDLEGFLRARERLPRAMLPLPPEALQRAAVALQAPFVRWVDACMEARPPLDWLATPFNRNTFDSNLFLHVVWLTQIDMVASEGGADILVITRSEGLARALTELCHLRGWPCRHHGRVWQQWRQWRLNGLALAKWFGKLLLLGYKAWLSRRIFDEEYVRTRLAGVELLLETYVLDGDMGPDGSCRDRYFPGLMDYYRKRGMNAGYFPHLFRIPWHRLHATFTSMRRGEVPFVPYERFVTLADVCHAAWTSLHSALSFRRFGTQLAFQGVPVVELVRAENFVNGVRSLIPAVLAHAPAHMAHMGIRPKWYIDWFENQVLDKGVALGVRKYWPECCHIAARQYVPYGNALHFFSSTGEVRGGVAPITNWVCGEALAALLSRHDTEGRYAVVPALRYAGLYRRIPEGVRGDALLVLLTHSMEESMTILRGVAALCGLGIPRFIVKTHPNVPLPRLRENVRQQLPELETSAVEWADGMLADLLPLARCVVTAGSSAAVEAVCAGVPVVLVGRSAGLDFNPLEGVDKRMWGVAHDTQELADSVRNRFSLNSAERASCVRFGRETCERYFLEVNEGSMAKFALPCDNARDGMLVSERG